MAPRPPTPLRAWEEPLAELPPLRLSLLALVSRDPQDVDFPLALLDRLRVLEVPALALAHHRSPAAQLASAALLASAVGEDPQVVDLVRFALLVLVRILLTFYSRLPSCWWTTPSLRWTPWLWRTTRLPWPRRTPRLPRWPIDDRSSWTTCSLMLNLAPDAASDEVQ
jgi:hypothetical protein